jgi:hypothetical protein
MIKDSHLLTDQLFTLRPLDDTLATDPVMLAGRIVGSRTSRRDHLELEFRAVLPVLPRRAIVLFIRILSLEAWHVVERVHSSRGL